MGMRKRVGLILVEDMFVEIRWTFWHFVVEFSRILEDRFVLQMRQFFKLLINER